MYLLPCKYRYHTIISGKNIKEKKLVSKISFLGHLKILDLTEKKNSSKKWLKILVVSNWAIFCKTFGRFDWVGF